MRFSASLVSAAAAALVSVRAAADGLSISSDADIKSTAKTVAGNLLKYYKGNEAGEIPGILPGPPPSAGNYYWWTASAMWASLIDYWHFTGDSSHNDVVMKGLLWQAGSDHNYMPANWTSSMGNDDQGFWGIAAMTAAERGFASPPRNQPQWLGLAQNVFENLAHRWDAETCEGGLRWQILSINNGYDYKNSISNGVLLNLGARLNRYTGNSTFGNWADKAWTWAEEAGLMRDGAIYDGAHAQMNCSDTSKIEFSYNSGVYILGAAHMYNTTSDSKWKDRLDSVLKHGLKLFFKDGAAYEVACESVNTCASDMTFFKGIFVQMLASAAQIAPHIADTVLPVLQKSAEAAVKSCGGGSGNACGFDWTAGKFDDKASAGSECSVLSSVAPLLAKAGDAPYTAKTRGASSSSSSGGSSSSTGGNGTAGSDSTADKGDGQDGHGGNGGKDGKDGSGDRKGAASKMGGSIAVGLVMTCAAILLL